MIGGMKIFAAKPDDERFVDLSGTHQGAWLVLGYAGADSRGQNRRWWCRCLCGMEKSVRASLLSGGESKCCAAAGCRTAMRRGEVCEDRRPGGIDAERIPGLVLAGVREVLSQRIADFETYSRLVVRTPDCGARAVTVLAFDRRAGGLGSSPAEVTAPLDLSVCRSLADVEQAARGAGRFAGSVLASQAAAR